MDFKVWDRNIRDVLQIANSPLELHAGRYWEIKNKFENFHLVKDRIFDKHLDLIKGASLEVLREIDPKFDLECDILTTIRFSKTEFR